MLGLTLNNEGDILNDGLALNTDNDKLRLGLAALKLRLGLGLAADILKL
jgi:hypothetical protein